MGIFRKLGWFFKQEKSRYIKGITFLLLVALVQLIPPRVIGNLADKMDNQTLNMNELFKWLIILGVAGILQYLFRYGWRNQIWGGAALLEKTLRSRLFWHFMKMDQRFFQTHRTGDLMAHATNDLSAIQNVAGAGILTFADSIITGSTTIIAMLVLIDWRLTLIALIPMPILAVAARKLGMKMHEAFGDSQAAFSRLNDKTQESVTGMKVIKTFGQDQEDAADFNDIVKKTIKINKRVAFYDALFGPSSALIVGASYILTIIVGGNLVNNGSISIGQLISFVGYIGILIWPMFAIGRLFNVLERGNASYDRVHELLQEKSGIKESTTAIQTMATGDIHYDIQTFTYPGDDQPSLSDIVFTIKQGQTLGIVGRVGSGKTTILRLLLREFDTYEGEINFGGHDIKTYSLDALRDAIGFVPQDNFLFSTTVRDNIRFGDFDKNQNEVEHAAVLSAVHEEIGNFEDGYDTMVGERGVSLSGGQKQRLAIARAMITDPEVLILDDALSAVDAKTEEAILHFLKDARHHKTTIIAAHRLSSVMHANEILVIEKGSIIQRGNHQELMEHPGWYAEMFHKQQSESKLGGGHNGD